MMLNDYFAPTLYQALLAEVNWNLEMEYVSNNLLFILIRLLGKNEKTTFRMALLYRSGVLATRYPNFWSKLLSSYQTTSLPNLALMQ